MEQITLKPLNHRGQECIGIYFARNNAIQTVLQKKAGAKWSSSQGCWYTSCTGEKYELIRTHLKDKAILKVEDLRGYLLKRGPKDPVPAPIVEKEKTGQRKRVIKKKKSQVHILSKENEEALRLFKQHMILKRLSENTIRTYYNEFRQFLNLIKDNTAASFSVPRLKDYLQYCHSDLKLSASTIHSRINALKFYYEQVLGREKFFWEVPRPKKPLQLPNVLGENEIARLFNSVSNLKHKAILFTAYSAGLRVSEVTDLKLKHVDSDRMQLLIKDAKGDKDRYVPLSPVVLDILRAYLVKYEPRPLVYVFEGIVPGKAYSHRSAQKIFQTAKIKSRIRKDISFHGLRHSFATHLLKKGIDVKYIQELLGHFDIKTTMRYLHVRKEDLVNIVSPLDDLFRKGGIKL